MTSGSSKGDSDFTATLALPQSYPIPPLSKGRARGLLLRAQAVCCNVRRKSQPQHSTQ
jgi:hypothetical protein